MAGLLDLLGMGQTFGAGGGGLLDGLRDRSNQLTGLGAGLLSGNNWQSGLSQGFQSGALGKAIDMKAQEKKKQENATAAWLAQHPELDQPTRDYLSANPEAAGNYFSQITAPKKPLVVGAGDTVLGPDMKPLYQAPQTKSNAAPTTREFFDKETGQNIVQQWDGEGWRAVGLAPQTRRDVTQPPSGFTWNDANDPTKGVTPIPGGPAEQLPSEAAARMGLAKSYLGQSPDIQKAVDNGVFDGPDGKIAMTLGMGEAGNTYRQIQSGVDALTRNLTGAGMSIPEAEGYAKRYLPGLRDTNEQIKNKLKQLDRELTSTGEMVGRGHGGNPLTRDGDGGPQSTADPLGIR